MLIARRGWGIAAGIILVATTGTAGMAQDTTGTQGSSFRLAPVPTRSAGRIEQAALVSKFSSTHDGHAAHQGCQSGCDGSVQQPAKQSMKRRHQAKWWGYPEEFCELPFGQSTRAIIAAQLTSGQAARMVLYHYDFVAGSDQLSARGRIQLAKFSGMMPTNFLPIVIEQSLDASELDERRRSAVLNELAQGTFPVPAERVVVASPRAIGIDGVSAETIAGAMIVGRELSAAKGATETGTGIAPRGSGESSNSR